MEAFEARVTDEVIECRRMFGDPDYLLWVAAADLSAYEQLYTTKLVGLPGVARTGCPGEGGEICRQVVAHVPSWARLRSASVAVSSGASAAIAAAALSAALVNCG